MKNKAFTLVELMVVIAIIAILAVGSISGYGSYMEKARDNQRLIAANALMRDFELALTEGKQIEEIFGDDWETYTYTGGGWSEVWGAMITDDIYENTTLNKQEKLNTPSSFLFSQGVKYPSIEDKQYNYLRGASFYYYDDYYSSGGATYEHEEFYLAFAFEREDTCEKMKFSDRLSLVTDLESIGGNINTRDYFTNCYVYAYTSS